ncbi:uncharacterized protein F4822DRAFT_413521 [Hypoxylon trugodes]|uniref:uncharacterized protein n=1 Tax=Hypoxylon trugodes TaxID=326681 RepID=UPI00218EBE30|nr:uncharacterized protein F4822DRAFT_413521 [Hypoxylon trugodes]KAI1385581.1 hypothetical protein F4822DRAFT_413521 [Hypoxylon trugodes]
MIATMSEESDIEDRVASDENDSPGESDSDRSDISDANGLLDMEAIESDDQSEDYDDFLLDTAEPLYLPGYNKLPQELRTLIWEYFDPLMKAKARVFALRAYSPDEISDSALLASQTKPARTIMSINSECRQLALPFYPNTLEMTNERGLIRYRDNTDIILLEVATPKQIEACWFNLKCPSLVAFNENPLNWHWEDETLMPRLFQCFQSYGLPITELKWCASNLTNTFYHRENEEYQGIINEIEIVYCWPGDHWPENSLDDIHPIAWYSKQPIYPLIEVSGEDIPRLEKMQAAVAAGDALDSGSDDSEEESDVEDEYESEGIDDATIGSDEDQSEDDDLVVQSGIEDNESVFDGFSPIQDEDPELLLGNGSQEVGNFSSLEPESPSHNSEPEQDNSDEGPTRKINRRKRRIVSSDDEEDNEEEEEKEGEREEKEKEEKKRAKTSSRYKRRRVVSEDEDEGDNDDEDEEPKPKSLLEIISQSRQGYLEQDSVSTMSDRSSNTEVSKENTSSEEDGAELQDDEVGDEDEFPSFIGASEDEGDDGW